VAYHRDIPEQQRQFARRLRREMTDPERRLWHALRGKRFDGFGFRRQVPIARYIADFVCHGKRLVIELDGEQHGWDEKAERDVERTRVIEAEGYRVIRFWNFEVMQSFDVVLDRIWDALTGESP
jgi:Uncharacterized protein conserved in bacteria